MSNLGLGPLYKGEALPCLGGPPLTRAVCQIPHDVLILYDRLSSCQTPQKPLLGQPNLLGGMDGATPPDPTPFAHRLLGRQLRPARHQLPMHHEPRMVIPLIRNVPFAIPSAVGASLSPPIFSAPSSPPTDSSTYFKRLTFANPSY